MKEYKMVKRLGMETLKHFLDNFDKVYEKYEERAKDYDPSAILIFERQGKEMVFYVEMKDEGDDFEEVIIP